MTVHDDALRRELERLAWSPAGAAAGGLVYRGPADFVLRHGERYEPCPFPRGVQRGAPCMCFGNAVTVAELYGLGYVEGYALTPAHAGGEVFHHAWNRDREGGLADSTWLNTGAAYLGVSFSVGRADDATWNGDATVLDDFRRGWPLLREPWEGEDPGRAWEPSEVLRAVRSADRDLLLDQLRAEHGLPAR